MKEIDKYTEDLVDKMMSESFLVSPSVDFTSRIMNQVLVAEKSKIKVYKPLISKFTWVFIGLGLIALSIYSIFDSSDIVSLGTPKIYSDKCSALFSGLHFSKNILYAILIVPFMVLIQIGILKNYFDKKYDL